MFSVIFGKFSPFFAFFMRIRVLHADPDPGGFHNGDPDPHYCLKGTVSQDLFTPFLG